MKVFIIFLIAGAVVGLIAWKFIAIDQRGENLNKNLVSPYLSLIQKNNLGEAYSTFTSDGFRKEHTLESFSEYFKSVTTRHGPLKSWKYLLTKEGSVPGKGSYIRLRYRINYQKSTVFVVYEVKEFGDKRLIDRTFIELPGSLMTPSPQ